ncbi:MAG TPA: NAD(P)(+) transhydrogenase (Re/Si-specific) subunit beta [Thermodesulfobacteriota bacterium]|nr:NAD(P)(+) transhydrogenase (Re/Si-specific) subunit beta [Thermodesulfobacteriota bacterium]
MSPTLVNLAYLVAAALFIMGLKGLSHPRTAVRGNMLGAIGMLIAIVVTLMDKNIIGYQYIIAGLAVGAVIGAVFAIKVEMTEMPELVALYNGFGGAASVFVAGAALYEVIAITSIDPATQATVAIAASGLIGAVTLFGSLVAFGKLKGILGDAPFIYSGEQIVKVVLAVIVLALSYLLVTNPENTIVFWGLVVVASVLGVLLVIAIGGADMPVVIALLNSYSGLAASATGFIINNTILVIAGTLVGASGIILTRIMCKAMNRSLTNVLFGGFGAEVTSGPSADDVYEGKVKATSAEEVAMLLEGCKRVCIVPGYGLAVAQAQHAVRDLTNLLEDRGVEVLFGIHPVAGRMPGHMNVLLAEADIPYDNLKEMDEMNPMFNQVDLSIVIGANDVVNPVARTDPQSPIAGMPILDVDYSKTVVIIKRSLSPGFAGIPNPLFALDNSLMLFGDAKGMVDGMVKALKEG